jgi:hypothetical protein
VLGYCCFIRVISEIRGLKFFGETQDFVPFVVQKVFLARLESSACAVSKFFAFRDANEYNSPKPKTFARSDAPVHHC